MAITPRHEGQRVYLEGDTFSLKDRIKSIGGKWDADRRAWWVGAVKAQQAQALVDTATSAPPPSNKPGDDTRIKAKVKYKGRTYYVIAEGSDRCRLTVLDGSIDFWADKNACELLKTYSPREYRGRAEYTTLGSIRRFIESQKRAEASGLPACAACGKRGRLVEDLEDGLLKCAGCADIPA